MEYLAGVTGSILSMIFIIFAIATIGYLVGSVSIKGISLGTAGVLLAALAYGILAHYVPNFTMGSKTIYLFSDSIKANFSLVSNLGTAMFVTAVGLIAGPKFFRTFNKKSLSYILLGVIIIGVGAATTYAFTLIDKGLSPSMAVGLMTGALTSTPGLSSAKEVAADEAALTAGYGIAYLFGVLGVVLFVQIIPRLLKVNIKEEREHFVAANKVEIKPIKAKLHSLEPLGFFPFVFAITMGCIIGSIKIPGINFSLGTSGGTLVAGLIVGHFGHVGPIDCRISKDTLDFLRELGLVLFLIGAGVPGGVNFVTNVKLSYFLYGAVLTTVPMVVGFILAKYVFKLSIFNNLGSITGGMTSTPALGALIATAGTGDVASAYAATYPIALVMVVLASKLLLMF